MALEVANLQRRVVVLPSENLGAASQRRLGVQVLRGEGRPGVSDAGPVTTVGKEPELCPLLVVGQPSLTGVVRALFGQVSSKCA